MLIKLTGPPTSISSLLAIFPSPHATFVHEAKQGKVKANIAVTKWKVSTHTELKSVEVSACCWGECLIHLSPRGPYGLFKSALWILPSQACWVSSVTDLLRWDPVQNEDRGHICEWKLILLTKCMPSLISVVTFKFNGRKVFYNAVRRSRVNEDGFLKLGLNGPSLQQ